MGRVRAMLFAGAATLLSVPAASAADLPMMPPLRGPIIQDFSGWYLRGDIGFSNQKMSSIGHTNPNATELNNFQSVGLGFDAAPLFGVGLGYQVNNWLRFDVTGEYRARANLHGASYGNGVDGGSAWHQVDSFSGSKSEALFLANAYVDLGTWWGVTPFIGAGVGTSYNMISGFRDDGFGVNQANLVQAQPSGNWMPVPTVSSYAVADQGKWNLAWAAHAGLSYRVTPNFSVELAYRYVNLGNAVTGTGYTYDNSVTAGRGYEIHDITSHDVKLGVRWMLGDPEPAYPPPALMRKG